MGDAINYNASNIDLRIFVTDIRSFETSCRKVAYFALNVLIYTWR
jgi:hypothetical protein